MINTLQIRIKESLSELVKIKRQQSTLAKEKRVQALIRLLKNPSELRSELALHLGVDRKTLRRWIIEYNEGGIDQMLEVRAKHKGSKIITQDMHDGLEKRLKDPRNSFRGYWDAQQWVKAEYGQEIHYHTLRNYLIQHFDTRVKQPRKSHTNKSESAVAVFKKPT